MVLLFVVRKATGVVRGTEKGVGVWGWIPLINIFSLSRCLSQRLSA